MVCRCITHTVFSINDTFMSEYVCVYMHMHLYVPVPDVHVLVPVRRVSVYAHVYLHAYRDGYGYAFGYGYGQGCGYGYANADVVELAPLLVLKGFGGQSATPPRVQRAPQGGSGLCREHPKIKHEPKSC